MSDEKKNGMTVLVCGGGNAAQVATAMIASRYETYAISLYADEAEKWKHCMLNPRWNDKTVGMELTLDTDKKLLSIPADITNDPSIASRADVIILAVPSFAHGQYFEAFEPYIKPGTVVACMPARSGGDILFAAKMGAKADTLAFVGFETLPWACRFTEWGKRATVLGTKGSILAAVTPESEAERAIAILQGLLGVFPRVLKSPNNLGISLRNPGQVIHPGVMYGRWCAERWDGKPLAEKPLFYQGVDDFTEGVLLGLSDEVQAVRKKVEEMIPGLCLKDACTLHQWYLDSYSGQMADDSTLKGCMNTNSAYRGLTHPMKQEADGSFTPDLKYRYTSEDVPTGLCFTRGLAELLGVSTPTMDKVLLWAQGCIGMSLLVDGKMCGPDVAKTRAPQAVGISTAEEFFVKAKIKPGKPSLVPICSNSRLPPAVLAELQETATKLCAPGKGFLAADESAGPWLRAGHAEAAKIPDTLENRAAYRSMCFSTPGLSDHISGVILHWETLFQDDAAGRPMVDIIKQGGMIAGIKVDAAYDKKGMWGTQTGPLGHPEVSTKGLDDLQQRCKKAYDKGARFAKWRNVLQLDPEKGLPSDLAIADTVHTLARYASICQSEGLVPIVEPEIVPNGTHDIAYCAKVTEKVLAAQFKALKDHHIFLEGCLLKPNMVKNGIAGAKADAETIATLTVQTLLRTVPANLPGIFFLSGETALDEDNEEVATINLSTMNKLFKKKMPWHLSFSYGKALQKTCIVTWLGKDENKEAAQKALKARANANFDAVMGTYVPGSCPSVGTDGNVKQAAGPY